MGKVQKKAVEKHKLSLSPAITEFIEKASELPLAELPSHLASIPSRWPFPRGDLYNWINPLDRFDEILQKFNSHYGLDTGAQTKPFGSTLLLEGTPNIDDSGLRQQGFGIDGDRELVEAILSFSRLLLEKCGNRTLYNSTERLNDLLNTTSLSLLHKTLRITLFLAQRYAERTPQAPHAQFYHYDMTKLQKLAAPFPAYPSKRGPQSPIKTSRGKDKLAQTKARRNSTTVNPNNFRSLSHDIDSEVVPVENTGRASEQEWHAWANVKVVWSSSNPSQAENQLAQLPVPETPASPTPVRRQNSLLGGSVIMDDSVPEGIVDTTANIDRPGSHQVDFSYSDLSHTSIEEILSSLPDSIPSSSRYELLHKLRIAYGLVDSPESRSLLLYIRLTALGVLGHILDDDQFAHRYFDGDPSPSARQHIIQQIVSLLRDPKKGQPPSTLYTQTLAIETLCILARQRILSPDITAALGPNSSHSLLMSLTQKGLEDMSQDGDATDNAIGDDWRDAIFNLYGTFMLSTVAHPHHLRSSEAVMHPNLISAYASGLKIITGKALRVHLRILDFMKNFFHQFKDGLQVLTTNGAFETACELLNSLASQAWDLLQTQQGIPLQYKTKVTDYQIPYMHQQVIRSMIDLVNDICGYQGNHADRALRTLVDSSALLNAFRLILSHMEAFGAHTWSEVVKAICGFLNNEPTSYTVVSEAGIIKTLLETVQPASEQATSPRDQSPRTISAVPSGKAQALPPVGDAIVNLSQSFSAICLTHSGFESFNTSGALEKFFEIFESPAHVQAIKDSNTLATLGSTFDELVRHHPRLKEAVLSSVITMVARVRHICRLKSWETGAGPKLWMNTESAALTVCGGSEALKIEIIPEEGPDSGEFNPITLPDQNRLVSGRDPIYINPALAAKASDHDSDGLSAADYARPAICFLLNFFENQSLCSDVMTAGATDIILDFISLPSLPVNSETFGPNGLVQELASLVHMMAENKPHLVLPLLADRARYACRDQLQDFVTYKPENAKCYFDNIIRPKSDQNDMHVEPKDVHTNIQATRLVKSMMSVYMLTQVLGEVFNAPVYSTRNQQNSLFSQVNLADVFGDLIRALGLLSAACYREEIALQRSIPETWLSATKPGDYSTGDNDIDKILSVWDDGPSVRASDASPAAEGTVTSPEKDKDQVEALNKDKQTAAFRNVQVLRYLLIETPSSISEFFLRIGRGIASRRRPETFAKQKAAVVADSLAAAYITQLQPDFLEASFSSDSKAQTKEARFAYFVLALSNVRSSLYDDSPTTGPGSARQSFVIDSMRREGVMKRLTEIGTEFFNELKSCQVAQSIFSANTGLKLCLEILDDFTTSGNICSSTQAGYMKNTERSRPYYFNPAQLLLELRMEALPLARLIWDSPYAEQASNDVVRKLISILKCVLIGDSEADAFRSPEDRPRLQPHQKRVFAIDAPKLAALKEKGYPEELAKEALYRCDSQHSTHAGAAEEYCKAVHNNSRHRQLPIPSGDLDSSIPEGPARLASPAPAVVGSAADFFRGTDVVEATLAEVVSGMSDNEMEDADDNDDDEDDGDDTPSHEAVPASAPVLNISTSPMNISNILNEPADSSARQGAAPISPAPLPMTYSIQSITAERESIRDDLVDRCNNVLNTHQNLTFELSDLITAASLQLTEENSKSFLGTAMEVLVVSLLSLQVDEEMTESRGKKIAATAHLIGLLSQGEAFKSSMLKILQESFDGLLSFLQLPSSQKTSEDAYPWVAPVLLIFEKMLALDAEPAEVKWTAPNDLEAVSEPRIKHTSVLEQDQKKQLFERLLDILPRVGKDGSMALSIVRVILILTRSREVALLQGEKKNLQRLFLMVKQLGNGVANRLQSTFMTVLRHIVEDDECIKQIMRSEIVAHFQARQSSRQLDLTSYVRELYPLVLRSPELFVEVTNEKIKLSSWGHGQHTASSGLALKEVSNETPKDPSTDIADLVVAESSEVHAEHPTDSIESASHQQDASGKTKHPVGKLPMVERPDGVIHFLLSELLNYKDVPDKEQLSSPEKTANLEGVTSEASGAIQADSQDVTSSKPDKSEKPRFKAEDHPIFMYRCFLLQCLTELLYSYNQTKVEFINFSRKADPKSFTPSKPRSAVLNYLLGSLVSSGYVDRDESVACKKQMATSEWGMRVVVALCSKTGELGLSGPTQRYSSQPQVDDNDTEPDLMFVRRFVLEHAIKSFKDTASSTENIQIKYGRLLCLADLFNKLLSKPAGSEGSAGSHNTSYKVLARMMFEKNLISILTSAISDIDLSYPGAKRVIKFILRPLHELTKTAAELSLSSPEAMISVMGQDSSDVISSASSEVSDIGDDREETPDLYRNSALGMLDRDHQAGSNSSEEEDDDEEMYDEEYDDEMDYDDGMTVPVNDGEVVSDEDLDEGMEDMGPIEGLPGDGPMDIQFVVEHHQHTDDDDDDDDDDSEDSSEDDDDEDNDDFEIEMDDDGEINGDDDNDSLADGEELEDDWEDEDDGEEAVNGTMEDEDDEDEDVDFHGEDLPMVAAAGGAHEGLNNLLRVLGEQDLGGPDAREARELIAAANEANEHEDDDEDDDGDDGDEMDENDGMDYDQGFDMMLDGPDDLEEQEWGWDEPPPAAFRRHRHPRGMGHVPSFISRRIHPIADADLHHQVLGRHHRHAPQGRTSGDDGTNPLMQRPEANAAAVNMGGIAFPPPMMGLDLSSLQNPFGGPGGVVPFGGPGGSQVITFGNPMGQGLGGLGSGLVAHGTVLDAIMNALQRGDAGLLRNGRFQLSTSTQFPPVRDMLSSSHHQSGMRIPREEPQRAVSFVPTMTIPRWQDEARMLFGRTYINKLQHVQIHIMSKLVPPAQEAEKIRRDKEAEERKSREEREAAEKIEAERKRKELEEQAAKEKVEAEAREKAEAEAEAAAAAAAEASATHSEQSIEQGEPMEGVQSGAAEPVVDREAPAAEQPRIYTTIRGRQLDITGLSIDAEYLEALPEDLREEVIMAQYQERAEQARDEGNDASALDPDFLDALPEEIRDELRHQEAQAQRRRDRERARRDAQVAAGGGGAASGTGNEQIEGMDNDDFFATLDPALRRAILSEQPPEILSQLAPQHAAEGRAHARNTFFHRMPGERDVRNDRGRREAAQRDNKRQLVQLIDKAGVATLLRLMFLNQQGSLRQNLFHILSNVCGNRQTRFEVVSLLLVVLKEGSTDITAVERSLASLSLRAKASGPQKTPQPLKRTLSMQPFSGVSEEVTPNLVVQQCLNALGHICRENIHVKTLFLREVDVTSGPKSKVKSKGKSRENKTTKYPVNDLISLLDRRLIMDSSMCLNSLAALLASVTSPLALLMKQEKDKKDDSEPQKDAEATSAPDVSLDDDNTEQRPTTAGGDTAMTEAPLPTVQSTTEPSGSSSQPDVPVDKAPADEIETGSDKKKQFDPPVITEHNLQLVARIFVAPECGNETFHSTLETLSSLSHISGTSAVFGRELITHVQSLSQTICSDLSDLLPSICEAQSSTDVQGVAAAKFSASTSDQVKLLRVLQALDYLSAPKKDGEVGSPSEEIKSILTVSYESLMLGPLWNKLSECLTAVREKGDTISFANILLPLIESLMVVCKNTTLKDAPLAKQIKETAITSPAPEDMDDLEELFYTFTSDHRKILNDIVRQSPKLMQGSFSILVKNSKVLDFDNKRNYFNKQIHSRQHNQRHPQPPLQLNVRRDQVFLDSYKALYFKSAEEMKYGKLNIRFNGEEGVDAGGVTREWFQVLARGMFDPNYALFQPVASDRTTFHPSPLSSVNPEHLLYFSFIGRIIGKALHEGRVLDCHFSRAVYKRILGKSPNLKDLESNDVDYYKSLVWILENDITDILTEEFCVIENEFGEEKIVDLIPDGRNISVAEDNKKEYVQKLVEYRLTESVKDQLDNFLQGFHDIIPAELIAIFNEQELELLISGLPEIDVDDWKANTEYHNYNPSSPQVVWFWRIVRSMTNEERAKLLQFITGTSKVPLNGFKELEGVSGLTRHNIHKDPSTDRLPTSHTCFNQLDLPAYDSFEVMKHNLMLAINLGADYFGFA